MTSRELLDAQAQLRGPLWALILEKLADRNDILLEAAKMTPMNAADLVMREQMLARGVIYKELFDEIPELVKTKLKEAQDNEHKT